MQLSISMMVRNESAHLRRALDSIKPLLDAGSELIIVDTGSIDNTVEIAKEFTDKIYHHPWANDFSLHRNQSFSYATGDFILQLDADEEMIFGVEDPKDFLKLIGTIKPDFNACALAMQDIRKGTIIACQSDAVRLFRRGTVTYRRKVHNEPMYEGKTGYIPEKICYMKHYGYDLTPYQQKKKAERSIPLLLKSIEDDPNDFDSLYYLANAYATWLVDFDLALKYAQEYLSHKEEIGQKFNQSTYYLICGIAERINKPELWRQMIEEGLLANEKDMDLWFSMIRYGLFVKNPDDLMMGATNYIRCVENFPKEKHDKEVIGQKFNFTYTPENICKGLYYMFLGNLETSMDSLERLELALERCHPAIGDEIKKNIIDDFKTFKLEDKRKEKQLIIKPTFGEKLAGLRRNHTMGNRR
jgi:glycosyltransferase involved in cell wall biosynthesis